MEQEINYRAAFHQLLGRLEVICDDFMSSESYEANQIKSAVYEVCKQNGISNSKFNPAGCSDKDHKHKVLIYGGGVGAGRSFIRDQSFDSIKTQSLQEVKDRLSGKNITAVVVVSSLDDLENDWAVQARRDFIRGTGFDTGDMVCPEIKTDNSKITDYLDQLAICELSKPDNGMKKGSNVTPKKKKR